MRRGFGPLAAVVLLLALPACSADTSPEEAKSTVSSTPSSSSTPTADPPPAPPKDACYRLDLSQLTEPTNDSRPVACSKRHTAQTIYVGRLELVVNGHALRVDSARARRQVAKECPSRFSAYVGGAQEDRDLSRLRVVWFSPTLEQAAAGARWFRCDLIAFGTDDALSHTDTPVAKGVLDNEQGRDRFGLCGTAAPGTTGFRRVQCGLDHAWRAITTIALDGGDRYPGEAAVREAGDSDCQDKAREVQDFALTFTYGWEWPTRAQWRAGQHYGYCWAPD